MSTYRAWYRNPTALVRRTPWDVEIEASDDQDARRQARARQTTYAQLVELWAVRVVPLVTEDVAK
jgi:hypothetical protein